MARKTLLNRLLFAALYALLAPVLLLLAWGLPRRRDTLIWGPVPIINNTYWSRAMRAAGWRSETLMKTVYAINRREDFDRVFDDLVPRWVRPAPLRLALGPFCAFLHVIRRGSVHHHSFFGGPLGMTPLWRLEAPLLKLAGVKTVVIPYGADVFMYSQVMDPTVRDGLLRSYPEAGRNEARIRERVEYWVRHADVIVTGFTLDGLGRWDVPVGNMVTIDLEQWACKADYSAHDGRSGPVRVLHSPNHRGVKGTETLLQAVEELRQEGLQIDLVLLEKVPNEQVREKMQDVDLMADQFILPGYGLAAIEGMASGLPVLSNLDNELYTRLFRRHSFLDECPIVSTTPETLKENLRVLVTRPDLRQELGLAGRRYAEKYKSPRMAQYLFGAIYDVLLKGRDTDLMDLFHPLKSPFNRATPRIEHPLVANRFPPGIRDLDSDLA